MISKRHSYYLICHFMMSEICIRIVLNFDFFKASSRKIKIIMLLESVSSFSLDKFL